MVLDGDDLRAGKVARLAQRRQGLQRQVDVEVGPDDPEGESGRGQYAGRVREGRDRQVDQVATQR